VLAAWSRACEHWGRRMSVRAPSGAIEGVALRLDADGGLVLRLDDGREHTVVAGDVAPVPEGRGAA